jgi:hypothetical protein
VKTLGNIKALLMNPFNDIVGLADNFVKKYSSVFDLIKKVKDAYTTLKEG